MCPFKKHESWLNNCPKGNCLTKIKLKGLKGNTHKLDGRSPSNLCVCPFICTRGQYDILVMIDNSQIIHKYYNYFHRDFYQILPILHD